MRSSDLDFLMGQLTDVAVRKSKSLNLLHVSGHFEKSARFLVISFPYLQLRVRETKESFRDEIPTCSQTALTYLWDNSQILWNAKIF